MFTKTMKCNEEQIKKLYIASNEMLENYKCWLEMGIPASEKESERLYTNLLNAVENIKKENGYGV